MFLLHTPSTTDEERCLYIDQINLANTTIDEMCGDKRKYKTATNQSKEAPLSPQPTLQTTNLPIFET